MPTTRVLTLLAAAAAAALVALVLAPASSPARPIQERAQASHRAYCYQLNPVVPGLPRGVHRVLCGWDLRASARR